MSRMATYGLVVLGLAQIAGYLLESHMVRRLGIFSVASPFPLVFTSHQGVEYFASTVVIEATTVDGVIKRVKTVPSHYARVRGPNARRAPYRNAIAYGMHLSPRFWYAILWYGFCNSDGPLWQALDLSQPLAMVSVEISTRTARRSGAWQLEIICRP